MLLCFEHGSCPPCVHPLLWIVFVCFSKDAINRFELLGVGYPDSSQVTMMRIISTECSKVLVISLMPLITASLGKSYRKEYAV